MNQHILRINLSHTDLTPTSIRQHKTHTDQISYQLPYTKDQFEPHRPPLECTKPTPTQSHINQLIPKPIPKLADNFGQYHNRYRNYILNGESRAFYIYFLGQYLWIFVTKIFPLRIAFKFPYLTTVYLLFCQPFFLMLLSLHLKFDTYLDSPKLKFCENQLRKGTLESFWTQYCLLITYNNFEVNFLLIFIEVHYKNSL